MKVIGRIWGLPDAHRPSTARLILSLLVLSDLCLFGEPAAAAQTSTYLFVHEDSTVVKTGGFAGVYETYFVAGRFQLTVDSETGAASFDAVDAKLTAANGQDYPQNLDEIFNMIGLAGTIIDRTTIHFEGTSDDGSSVLIILTFLRGNTVTLKGQTTPPADSADFFIFALDAVAEPSDDGEPPIPAWTGTYVFDPNRSTVVKTGGFAGVHITYSVKGQFQLTVDWGNASFGLVDASLIDETGSIYARSLNEIFNLTGQTGDIADVNGTIVFAYKTADGTDSDVRLTLTLGDDAARLVGKTTPPPNSADMFFYELDAAALRKYAGGTGEPNTPYLISSAEQMNAIGAEPDDWDKHFKLAADIDLGGYRGTDFNIIAPVRKGGRYFTGLFDGGGHTISNFTYNATDANSIALFGNVRGRIENVGLIDPNIDAGTANGVAPLVDWLNGGGSMSGCYVRGGSVCGRAWVGGLVAYNTGTITDCYSTAAVTGGADVGGLAGDNAGAIAGCYSTGSVTGASHVGGLLGFNDGTITGCSSSGDVAGGSNVGGLVGNNRFGILWECSSTGRATGLDSVAGLVGRNSSVISSCYSSGDVSGEGYVGGLVGRSYGIIADCYSISDVFGEWVVGGLVGLHVGEISTCYSAGGVTANLKAGGLVGFGLPESVLRSFWDIETSGQATSAGGIGKTTAEMQTAATFLDAGWDFIGETDNGTEDIWRISEGLDYPRLSWQKYSGGTGQPGNPYQIATAEDLMLLGASPEDYDKHFILTADIDLDPNLPGRKVFDRAVIAPDTNPRGLLDWEGTEFTGVFDGNGHTISHLTISGVSYLGMVGVLAGQVKDLGVVDVKVLGSGYSVAGLVGANQGAVTNCCSTGSVSGDLSVGGLVGYNTGRITDSHTTARVKGGIACVGGLVGENGFRRVPDVGPELSTPGTISNCYSAGQVVAELSAGGLVGTNVVGEIQNCFWDVETSRQTMSDGGTGKTTAEMQTARTFLDAGWDFVGETTNGTQDIWWILEGRDYPRLWWEAQN